VRFTWREIGQVGREHFDGPIEQRPEGVAMSTGADLDLEILEVGILDECPDERRQVAGRDAGES